jgi:glutaredoxin-like protein
MAMLSERDRGTIQDRLRSMEHPVGLINFTQELEAPVCFQTRSLLHELAETSDQLTLEVYDFQRDLPAVTQYGVDKIPATAIVGERDHNIRIYGLPAGYVLAEMLETILMVSRRRSGLQAGTAAELREVARPLHLQVFVAPTCPFCPAAVRLATRFAMENDLIRIDVVEITAFPQLVQRFAVRSVPKTVVNGTSAIEGVLPEDAYLARVLGRRPVVALQTAGQRGGAVRR